MANHRVKHVAKKSSKAHKGMKIHGGFKSVEHKSSRKRGGKRKR